MNVGYKANGPRLLELRRLKRWSQETLEEVSQVSKKTIYKAEHSGSLQRFSLEALARALGTSIDDIVLQEKQTIPGCLAETQAPYRTPTKRPPHCNIPALPKAHVSRAEVIQHIKTSLVTGRANAVEDTMASAFTIGIHGIAGIGKTTVAVELARDPEIANVFRDGILWIQLGKDIQPARSHEQEYGTLSANRFISDLRLPQDIDVAKRAFDNGHCLIILDNLCSRLELDFVSRLSPYSAVVYTTRNIAIRDIARTTITVNSLSRTQSFQLLGAKAEHDLRGLSTEADLLARHSYGHPFILSVIAEYLNNSPRSWRDLGRTIEERSALRIPTSNSEYHYSNLFDTIEASVEHLSPTTAEKFYQLAVFPVGRSIPRHIVSFLWKEKHFSDSDVRKTLSELAEHGLVDSDPDTLTLHDILREYLQSRANPREHHRKLCRKYHRRCNGNWHDLQDDGYCYQYLPEHLFHAGWLKDLKSILMSFRWLANQLIATEGQCAMMHYKYLPHDEEIQALKKQLRESEKSARERYNAAIELILCIRMDLSQEFADIEAANPIIERELEALLPSLSRTFPIESLTMLAWVAALTMMYHKVARLLPPNSTPEPRSFRDFY